MNIPFLRKKEIKLEDNLSFEQFSKQIQRLPIPPYEMEKFKNEAKRILKQRKLDYSNGNVLDVMYYDLYKLANYRPKCQ